MVPYVVKAKKNPIDATVKFYPQIGLVKAIDMREIAQEVSQMCTVTLPDVVGVFSAMQEEIENILKKGRTVRFKYLGSFRPTIVSNPAEKAEDVGVDYIKRVRVRFSPGGYLRRQMKKSNLKFKRA